MNGLGEGINFRCVAPILNANHHVGMRKKMNDANMKFPETDIGYYNYVKEQLKEYLEEENGKCRK